MSSQPLHTRVHDRMETAFTISGIRSLYREAKSKTRDAPAFKRETNSEWKQREKCADSACLAQWYQHRKLQLTSEIHDTQHSVVAEKTDSQPGSQVATTVAAPSHDDSSSVAGTFWAVVLTLGGLWFLQNLRNGKKQAAVKAVAASHPPVRPPPDPFISAPKPQPARTQTKSMHFEVRASSPVSPAPTLKPANSRLTTKWMPPDQATSVAGRTIPGGMLYIGNTLMAPDGSTEPAQLDPTLEIDSQPVDVAERLFGYWPRYDSISPIARRGYLTWLAEGRTDPTANIGYVFLFFYGLERRLLVDALQDPIAKAEIPAIVAEIERLRSIYSNGSFQAYSGNLLDFLSTKLVDPGLYLGPPPTGTSNKGLSLRMRIGLGQAAVATRPVPAEWALAWVHSEPNISLPGSARRCAEQFDMQFLRSYEDKFGEGMTLSINRTRLTSSYRPASPGLLRETFVSNLGNLPDVTTVVTPVKKLQALVADVAESLDAYSRFVSRHPDQSTSLEATLMLPRACWPQSVKTAFDMLDKRIGTGMLTISLNEVLDAFGSTPSLTRDTLKSVVKLLHDQGVGVEPDVLSGAKTPKAQNSVVLFRLAADQAASSSREQATYEAVAIMLDLALTLANADGKISGREVQLLNRQVDTWVHVGEAAQRRLRARLRLGIMYPPALSSLRSRTEKLPIAAREELAKLLSALAVADGKLRPESVKHLEKVYALLEIDSAILYSQLHVASATQGISQTRKASTDVSSTPEAGKTSAATPKEKQKNDDFHLDAARVAALQAESERVTALLSKVFEDQEVPALTATNPVELAAEEPIDNAHPGLLGLDSEHSLFLRALLERPAWSRAELSDIAADMELMLDGALERINEASLEAFDSLIAEGDDPIEIARELMENVSA